MSDIRFNQWLHQSGTGGVSQSDGGHVGIGTTNPLIPVGAGNTHILNVGVVTCNNISAGSSITAGTFYGSGSQLTFGSLDISGDIDVDGKVLIGTDTEGHPNADDLTIATSDDTGITIRSGTSHNGRIYFSDATSGAGEYVGSLDYDHNDNRFSIVTNGSEKLRIDSSGRLLLGTTTEGHPNADDLTIATSGDTGITIRSGTTHNGRIYFSDATSGAGEVVGSLDYDHNDNKFTIHTNGEERLRIASDGVITGRGELRLTEGTSDVSQGDEIGSLMFLNPANDNKNAKIAALRTIGTSGADLAFYTRTHGDATNTDGGIERFRIDSAGRVLIGTTTEGAVSANNLTIGSNTGYCGMTIRSGTSSEGNIFFSDATSGNGESVGMLRYEHANDAMVIKTANAERLRIKSDGKVGVGTDSPLSILSAYGENRGEGTVTGQITAKDNAAYNASPTAGIVFQGHYASNNAQAIFAGITGFKENANDGNLAGALALHVRANGAVAYEALRIKSDGNVIIGSGGSWSYPKALNVQGSSGSILSLYNADTTTYAANTTSAIEFKLLTGNTGNQSGSCEIRAFKENGTNGNNARALSFYTGGNGGSPSEKLRITSDGEVTKPNNPRFQAYMSGTHFQISGGSNNIAYNTEVYDVGSNYNTSNGRFTAPVDGAYYFQHCLQVRKALSGTGVIEAKVWVIPVGGSAVERIRDYKEVIATNMSGRAFGVLQLNAGDQVYPAYYSGINPTYVQNNGGNTPLTSFFEGYLVG